LEALTHFSCPIQNFTFACADGNIAVNHQGNLAVKASGQGRFVLDGSNDSSMSRGTIPFDSLPHAINPACNYLVSANQHPTDSNYRYYYNGFFSEDRAGRIDTLLARENQFTIDKVERIQLDNTNSLAVVALPILLGSIDEAKLNADEKILYRDLKTWNGAYDYDNPYAEMFEMWWSKIKEQTWDELRKFSFDLAYPDDYVLLHLIKTDPGNEYFDILNTSERETASDIIYAGFRGASRDYLNLKKRENVQWGSLNRINFLHPTRLPAFSKLGFPSAGCPQAINALARSWGPSWRMVVQLGDEPVAYGIYPGGQSGNPGSRYYDNFINDWGQGKYYRLNFYPTIAEARVSAKNTILLK
jgi:penicillin amidase